MSKRILLATTIALTVVMSYPVRTWAAPSGVTKIIHSGTNDPTSENAYPISNGAAHSANWSAGFSGTSTSGAQNGGWNVNGTVTGGGDAFYALTVLAADANKANTFGWVLTTDVEVLPRTAGTGPSAVAWNYVSGGSGAGPNYRIDLTLTGGALSVNSVSGSGAYSVPTAAGYHTYSLVHPAGGPTGAASLFVDGSLAITGIVGDGSSLGFGQVGWGDELSATQGNANFRLVEFNLPEPASMSFVCAAAALVSRRRRRV